jgi:hypothetical protein
MNRQQKINAETLAYSDFREVIRATNEQLLIRFRLFRATNKQQKRTTERR